MDDARTPEMLWNELLARCRAKDLEIPTATGLWFRVSASARGDAIVVTPAQRYYFKVSISAPRRISRRHFLEMHPHYLACTGGTPGARKCATQASRQTSYVFALYDYLYEGLPEGAEPG